MRIDALGIEQHLIVNFSGVRAILNLQQRRQLLSSLFVPKLIYLVRQHLKNEPKLTKKRRVMPLLRAAFPIATHHAFF